MLKSMFRVQTVLLILCTSAFAAEPSKSFELGHLLPETPPVAYAEIQGVDRILGELRDSELFEMVISMPQYAQFFESGDGRKMLAGIKIAETYLGRDLWTAASEILGGRVAVAVLPNPDGGDLLGLMALRFPSDKELTYYKTRLEPLIALSPDNWESEEIDDATLWAINDKIFVAARDRWLIAASTRDLCLNALEKSKATEPAETSLSELTSPVAIQDSDSRLITGIVDFEWVQTISNNSIPDQMDNPLGSLLFGHVPRAIKSSDRAVLALDADNSHLDISVRLNNAGLSDGPFEVFDLKKSNFTVPDVPELVGGISLSRNFAPWYGMREELLEDQALPGFDQFETGLGNLLPGRDFQHDVLPAFGPRMTFVAARQKYDQIEGEPGVKLPAFGLLVEMAKPNEAADLLTLFFQTLSAILNIEAGQQGRQPWVISSESYAGVQLTFARYLQKPTGDRLPLVFNFMPAAARVGDYYLLSTSRQLCRDLVDYVQEHPELPTSEGNEMHLEVHADTIHKLVETNGGSLIALGVRDGNSTEEAKGNLETLLQVIDRVQSLSLSMRQLDGGLEFAFSGKWN